MALPIRARPSFPHSQSLPSGNLPMPLILIHQRADRITENWPKWSHGLQPCVTQWNYEPCHVGPPKMDGSWWRVLTKRGFTGEGNGKPLQHSFLEKSLNSMKGQNHMKLKNEARRSVGAQYATGGGGEVAPGGMKRLSQSRNSVQFWICLVVKVRYDAVKNNIP